MCEVLRRPLIALAACMVVAEGFRVKNKNRIEFASQGGDICCCKLGSTAKDMQTYEAIKGSFFNPMHLYADSNQSSEQLGSISEGSKFWALNANPEEEGWLEIAYIKNGNVGTGWSRFAGDRYKRVETEKVKHTECTSSMEPCDPDVVTVPGVTDESVCETILSNVPVRSSHETEWLENAPTLLGERRDFFKERTLHLTTTLTQQAEHYLQKLEGLLQDLKASDYCVVFPPWCAFKHFKLSSNWGKLKSVVKKMAGYAGHEEMAKDLHANLAVMRDQELATKIAKMEVALVIAEMKSLDGSTAMRASAWTLAKASKSQYKAFCSGKRFYDEGDSWKNADWWEKMYAGCPKEGLTPEEVLEIEATVDSATDVPEATESVIRKVVAVGRGVSLLQSQESEELSPSSFVDRTEGVQGTRDELAAVLMFFFLSAMGCGAGVSTLGALAVL